jgi:hypothetical protein
MEVMGWSDASVAKRYMHVPAEFLAAIAEQVGSLIWANPTGDEDGLAASLHPPEKGK